MKVLHGIYGIIEQLLQAKLLQTKYHKILKKYCNQKLALHTNTDTPWLFPITYLSYSFYIKILRKSINHIFVVVVVIDHIF